MSGWELNRSNRSETADSTNWRKFSFEEVLRLHEFAVVADGTDAFDDLPDGTGEELVGNGVANYEDVCERDELCAAWSARGDEHRCLGDERSAWRKLLL